MSVGKIVADKPKGVDEAEQDGFTCEKGTAAEDICDSEASSAAYNKCGSGSNVIYQRPTCDYRLFGSSGWYCAKLADPTDFKDSVKCEERSESVCHKWYVERGIDPERANSVSEEMKCPYNDE